MLGFAGYAFVNPKDSDRMPSALAERFTFLPQNPVVQTFSQTDFGLCALARSENDLGVAVDEATQTTLVVHGQFAPSAFAPNIVKSGLRAVATALLNLYQQRGPDALRDINGRFVIAVWDARTSRLTLINDLLGLKRICWTRQNSGFWFSTEYKAILAASGVSHAPDEEGVAEFMALGYPLETRTLLKSVSVLPVGGMLLVDPDRENLWSSGIRFSTDPHQTQGDLPTGAAQLGERLDEVFADYRQLASDPLIVPLSGGLDSRTLLGYAERTGCKPIKTFTFGHSHCYDVRFAKRMARSLNLEHKLLGIPNNYVADWGPEEVSITEGETSVRYAVYAALKAALPQGGMIWSGFLGDEISGAFLRDFSHIEDLSRRTEALIDQRYFGVWGDRRNWAGDDLIPELVEPEFRDLFSSQPRANLLAVLNRQQSESFDKRAILAALEQRQRRFTVFQIESLSRMFDVITPFCDHRVVQFFLHLPDNFLQGQSAYRSMIGSWFPRLAAVPDVKSLQPVTKKLKHSTASAGPTIQHTIRFQLPTELKWRCESTRNAANAWLAKISRGWYGKHNRKVYVHGDEVARSYPDPFYDYFSQEGLLDPFFNQKAVLDLLEKHIAGVTNADPTLYSLWTYAFWRKQLTLL